MKPKEERRHPRHLRHSKARPHAEIHEQGVSRVVHCKKHDGVRLVASWRRERDVLPVVAVWGQPPPSGGRRHRQDAVAVGWEVPSGVEALVARRGHQESPQGDRLPDC